MENWDKRRLYEVVNENPEIQAEILKEFRNYIREVNGYAKESVDNNQDTSVSVVQMGSGFLLKGLSEKYDIDIFDLAIALVFYSHGIIDSKNSIHG